MFEATACQYGNQNTLITKFTFIINNFGGVSLGGYITVENTRL